MSQIMKAATLDHLNLTVTNFTETAEWYKEVFNFKIVETGNLADGSSWGVIQSGDSMLCIYERKREPSPEFDEAYDRYHRIYHFGLRIHDEVAWERKIKQKNLKLAYGGAVHYPFSKSWYVKDPSGHEIEVVIWNEDKVHFKSNKLAP